MYLPIALFSGTACWLYIARGLWPALRNGTFKLERHAVALAATAALLAHFSETLFYFAMRIDKDNMSWLLVNFEVVAPMKLIILFSSVLAVAVYNKAVFGVQNLMKLNLLALAVWAAGFVALLIWNP